MNEKGQTVKLEISFLTVVKIVGALLALVIVYLIREIFALLFISIILSSLIDPFADWLEQRKVGRSYAVLIIYIGLIAILAAVVVGLVPPLTNELGQLLSNLSSISTDQLFSSFKTLGESAGPGRQALEQSMSALQGWLTSGAAGLFGTLQGFVGNIGAFILILVLTFYFVVEEHAVRKFFRSITPHQYHTYFGDILPRVQEKLGAWLRAQMLLGLCIAILVYIGLKILGVKYALVLALFAGLAEFVPYFGPVLSAIPAIFLAYAQSPYLGIAVLVLYVVVQWVENHVLVPKIMQRVIGINPIVSIIALLVGAKLGGVVGAILAIPVATGILVFTQDFFAREETPHV